MDQPGHRATNPDEGNSTADSGFKYSRARNDEVGRKEPARGTRAERTARAATERNEANAPSPATGGACAEAIAKQVGGLDDRNGVARTSGRFCKRKQRIAPSDACVSPGQKYSAQNNPSKTAQKFRGGVKFGAHFLQKSPEDGEHGKCAIETVPGAKRQRREKHECSSKQCQCLALSVLRIADGLYKPVAVLDRIGLPPYQPVRSAGTAKPPNAGRAPR